MACFLMLVLNTAVLTAQTDIVIDCAASTSSSRSSECLAANVVSEVISRTAAIQAAWPGFWKTQEFGIYEPSWGMLVRLLSSPPAEFKPATINARAHDHLYAYVGSWPILQAGGVFPIVPSFSPKASMEGGIEVPTDSGRVVPVAVKLSPDVEGSVELIVHESFHSYQLARFANMYRTQRWAAPTDGPPTEDELQSLVREAELLRTLLASPPRDRTGLIQSYLALRDARFRADSIIAKVERHQERVEGTAEYVGIRGRLPGAPAEIVRDTIAQRISHAYHMARASRRTALQARPYATGAALAFLLDQMGVSWRQAVERGAYLDDVLRNSLTRK